MLSGSHHLEILSLFAAGTAVLNAHHVLHIVDEGVSVEIGNFLPISLEPVEHQFTSSLSPTNCQVEISLNKSEIISEFSDTSHLVLSSDFAVFADGVVQVGGEEGEVLSAGEPLQQSHLLPGQCATSHSVKGKIPVSWNTLQTMMAQLHTEHTADPTTCRIPLQ